MFYTHPIRIFFFKLHLFCRLQMLSIWTSLNTQPTYPSKNNFLFQVVNFFVFGRLQMLWIWTSLNIWRLVKSQLQGCFTLLHALFADHIDPKYYEQAWSWISIGWYHELEKYSDMAREFSSINTVQPRKRGKFDVILHRVTSFYREWYQSV